MKKSCVTNQEDEEEEEGGGPDGQRGEWRGRCRAARRSTQDDMSGLTALTTSCFTHEIKSARCTVRYEMSK